MALLLRMAGIPARVVTGFSTGATDTKTGEYVVRDFDAHSWVEVYYPGWGWLTFDPTPAASPARSQPSDRARTSSGGSAGGTSFGGDPLSERGAGVAIAAEQAPWWRIPALVAGALALLGLFWLALRRWRRGAPPALTELERALRRTRREPAPGTTLHALELRFSATPAAAGYVRALRESRYRDEPRRPTRAQRRALRSELGRGGGIAGSIACLVGPAAALAARLQLRGWTMSMTSISEGWRCWRTDTSTRPRSRSRRRATSSPTRPRSARRWDGRISAPAASRRHARSSRRWSSARPRTTTRCSASAARLMQLGRAAEARKPLTLAANMNPKRRDYRIYRDRARKAA